MLKKIRLAVSLIMLVGLVEAQEAASVKSNSNTVRRELHRTCEPYGGFKSLLLEVNNSRLVECKSGEIVGLGSPSFIQFVEEEFRGAGRLEIRAKAQDKPNPPISAKSTSTAPKRSVAR